MPFNLTSHKIFQIVITSEGTKLILTIVYTVLKLARTGAPFCLNESGNYNYTLLLNKAATRLLNVLLAFKKI